MVHCDPPSRVTLTRFGAAGEPRAASREAGDII